MYSTERSRLNPYFYPIFVFVPLSQTAWYAEGPLFFIMCKILSCVLSPKNTELDQSSVFVSKRKEKNI